MNRFDRRAFLYITPLAVGAAIEAFVAINSYKGSRLSIAPSGAGGYGGLRPVKARNTGETAIALTEGFEYTVIGKTGTKMSDGYLTPAAHDGMAAYIVNGELR